MKLKVIVREIAKELSTIEVQFKDGLKEISITRTERGHTYTPFNEWEITNEEYYALETLVLHLIFRMNHLVKESTLDITWDKGTEYTI